MTKPESIIIDEVEYIREDLNNIASPVNGMKYCVVRTISAGVHIGYVKEFGEKHHMHAFLINSRRLHYWNKAASLSQVAIDGVCPVTSRIAMKVPEIELTEVIEVIPCSKKALDFFENAKVWKI